MKKFFYFFLAVIVFVATSAIGQPTNNASAPAPTYTVQKGDTLWTLAAEKLRDPRVWTTLVRQNPFLQERGRIFSKGDKTVVLLKPGEQLVGLEELGLLPDLLPISTLQAPALATVSAPWPTPAPVVVEDTTKSSWPWYWLLFFFLIGALITRYWSSFWNARKKRAEEERELFRDPVTSGTPYVPGGISATEPERLTNFFTAQAVESYVHRYPTFERSAVRVEFLGPIESGVIFGEGEVGYLGGEFRSRRISEPGIQAYRVRVRMPDGTEEVLCTLAGCMNPLRGYSGDVYRGFTFRSTGVVPVLPTPTSVTASVTPTQVTAPSTDHPEEGVIKFELRRATPGQPAMVRITGVDETGDNTVELRSNVLIFRYTPRS